LIAKVARFLVRGFFALPDGVLTRIFGHPPAEAPGLMPDSWALARLVDRVSNDDDPDPESGRRETETLAALVRCPVQGVRSEPWTLEWEGRSLDARLFVPESDPTAGPMLLHFHGGGWVQGSVESHSGACALLARNAGVRVLSVEYRLAPEHRFPAQAEDALTAWHSVMTDPARFGADPGRVGVSGDSAGGHIATVLCHDLKEAGEAQPACQVLIYPVTDCSREWPSKRTFARGYYLTKDRMDWFESCFIPEGEAANPRVSPLLVEDLSGLAPALVSVSIADPLRDEGIAYAARLHEAGVPVTLDEMPMLHAWFNVTASRSTRKGHEVLARRVKDLFALSQ
jgi:acetyl esterase